MNIVNITKAISAKSGKIRGLILNNLGTLHYTVSDRRRILLATIDLVPRSDKKPGVEMHLGFDQDALIKIKLYHGYKDSDVDDVIRSLQTSITNSMQLLEKNN